MPTERQRIDPTFVGAPDQLEALRHVVGERSGTHSKTSRRELRVRVRAAMSGRAMSRLESTVDFVVDRWRSEQAAAPRRLLGNGGWQ